ncbi:hypothetical protein R4B10_19000, partial [Serratia marcescens]|uniref:hypothetical protein n=1 Tax=Serratia marcescens TaxID=615 RepID=UPI002965DABE
LYGSEQLASDSNLLIKKIICRYSPKNPFSGRECILLKLKALILVAKKRVNEGINSPAAS